MSVGCQEGNLHFRRNTVFGAEAQEASRHLQSWRDAGIRHFRIEFVHETAQQVTQIAQALQQALAGTISMPALTQQLHRIAPQGTTEGSLFVPDAYLSVPLLQ